jgi:hypothetical protein
MGPKEKPQYARDFFSLSQGLGQVRELPGNEPLPLFLEHKGIKVPNQAEPLPKSKV